MGFATKKPAIPNQSLNTAGLMRANTAVSQTANAGAPVVHDRPSEITLGFRTMDGPPTASNTAATIVTCLGSSLFTTL